MAIYGKVSGSSPGKKKFILVFFNKNRHEKHKGHAMIFMCDKKCQTAIFDRDDGIRQQPPSQFQKQTHGLFFIRVLCENKKKPFGLRT